MAGNMRFFWLSLLLSVIGTHAEGEFSILYNPDSLKFSGYTPLLESVVKEVFSASLGLSVEENAGWNGLSVSDPFNTPEAGVEVFIDGISSLGNLDMKKISFPVDIDEYEPDTFGAVQHRIKQRYATDGNKLVNLALSKVGQEKTDVFGDMPVPKVERKSLQHLKYNVEVDYDFMSELEGLKAVTAKVASGAITPDNLVDFYYFRFQSLHALLDFHGPHSLQAKEAKKLLGEGLEALSKAFNTAYDGSVLVTVLTTDVAHTRRSIRSVRQSLAQRRDGDDEDGGEAAPADSPAPAPDPPAAGGADASVAEDEYSEDYGAIFNIILWFGVVFSFALISIIYALMDMDPGRDSIIYRMTSTRIKKDN